MRIVFMITNLYDKVWKKAVFHLKYFTLKFVCTKSIKI